YSVLYPPSPDNNAIAEAPRRTNSHAAVASDRADAVALLPVIYSLPLCSLYPLRHEPGRGAGAGPAALPARDRLSRPSAAGDGAGPSGRPGPAASRRFRGQGSPRVTGIPGAAEPTAPAGVPVPRPA